VNLVPETVVTDGHFLRKFHYTCENAIYTLFFHQSCMLECDLSDRTD